ncbi:MAG: hypothetical protein WKF82_07080 [Nocardioidaceae bacterium]
MTRHPFDQAAMTLGLAGIASLVFSLTTSSNNNFVLVQGPGLLIFPLLGLCALVGGAIGVRMVVRLAGAAYAAAAILQLAQFGRSTNWIQGNGSTFALLLALGVGLLVVGFTPRRDTSATTPADRARRA